MPAFEKQVSASELRKSQDVKKTPIRYPFWFGGSASCFAACLTHPLDLVKVRLQMQGHQGPRLNMIQMFGHVAKTDGIMGLYRGVGSLLLCHICRGSHHISYPQRNCAN